MKTNYFVPQPLEKIEEEKQRYGIKKLNFNDNQMMAAQQGMYAQNIGKISQNGISQSVFLSKLKKPDNLLPIKTKKQYSNDVPINLMDSSTKIPSFTNDELQQKYILIQKTYKKYKCRKAYKIILKQHRYRKNVILELLKTEEAYVADLNIIISRILAPLQEDDIISDDQAKQLGSNIHALRETNTNFLLDLKKRFTDNYVGPYVKIGDLLSEYAPYFKMYSFYYNDFGKIDSNIQMLKKDNLQFNQFAKKMTQSIEFRFLDIESYLVKPVQRLPKYVLLMNDLLKHTDSQHPDFLNIKVAAKMYSEVTDANNFMLDKVMKNSKLFVLNLQFPEIKILEAQRNFLSEEQMQIYWKNKLKPALVYWLSDLIIVVKKKPQKTEKLIVAIFLNEDSFVKDLPDTQYFANLFTLIGQNDSITFVEQNRELKSKRLSQFDSITQDLKNKSDQRQEAYNKNQLKFDKKHYPLEVTVIGTEQRHTHFLKKYTIYIIDVTIHNVAQKIFVRYSNFRNLQLTIKNIFPMIQISYMKDNENPLVSGNSAKEIEARTIQLTQFLQTLLQSQEFRNSALNKTILQEIGLPSDFYNLPDFLGLESNLHTLKQQRSCSGDYYQSLNHPSARNGQSDFGSFGGVKSSKDLQLIDGRRSSGVMLGQKFSASKLIRSSGEVQGKNKPPLDHKSKGIKEDSISIRIISYHPNKPIMFYKLKHDSKTLDLFQFVSEQLSIKETFDFKFLISDKNYGKTLRPLSDDEMLYPLFSSKNLLDKLLGDQSDVFFRKYIYLEEDHDKQQFSQDPVKLSMVYNQYIGQLSNYFLNFQDCCLLACIHFFVNGIYIQQLKDNKFPFHRLKEIIPETILKNTKKELWQQCIPDKQKQVSQSIAVEGLISSLDQYSIAKLIFISKVSVYMLFGKQLFQVQTSKETKAQLQVSDDSIYIGVGIAGLTFYDLRKKNQIRTINYPKLNRMKALAGQLIIEEENKPAYVFICSNGYQIQQLVDEYIQIIHTIDEGEEFEDIQISY